MFVVKYRKIFYTFSGILVILSVAAMFVWGFNLGIDFKGGSVLEVAYTGTSTPPSLTDAKASIDALKLGNYSLIPTGSNGYTLRTKDITPAEKTTVENALSQNGKLTLEEKQFDSIGPVLGQESKNKALISISLVLLAIVLFIAFAFRKVSKPISSWVYGVVAVVALVHDVIIPTGVFVLLGHFKNFEIDTLFVTALLVILGFSIHDTIVVFDRVRENLRHDANNKKPFDQIVGESISQTFTRSINTSLTVLLSLVVLYFVGSVATHDFVLALLIGIAIGTYSSIFIGSPLLVTIAKWTNKA
ncbi:TPA: protein translocase subunit SecF [Candidatus Taylorbacteria bacterium]|nr:protein translocase subunit SecF [Candidatus Taylorbacteria bacterium]